ncbi:MAG: XrtA/PEP-CTERM system exopolysaccharide export protein [Tepidisphaeraceae bacterium]
MLPRFIAVLVVSMLAGTVCLGPERASATEPVETPAPVGAESNYIIGPGDTIQVFVWRNPELSVVVPVRPDGKVSTPLVEDIVAVGKRPSELARDIETRLAEYIRSPQVNVIVTDAQSSFSQITVIGQVTTPQTVPFREGMRMMDVLLAVGGLTEFAAGNRAKLIRKNAEGREQEIRVRLKDLLTQGRLDQNLTVQPGDVLIVPESLF